MFLFKDKCKVSTHGVRVRAGCVAVGPATVPGPVVAVVIAVPGQH